jgi:hypothetical protein
MESTQVAMGQPAAPAPAATHAAPPPRSLGAGAGASWWGEGWRIFSASPGIWILNLIILAVISVVLLIIPFIGGLALNFLMPVFFGGLMVGCGALARGEALRVGHLFAGFTGGRFGPLILLALIMFGIGIVFALIIGVIMFFTLGGAVLAAMAGGAGADPSNMAAMAGSFGIGAVIAFVIVLILGILIAMMYWMAPALIVMNGEGPGSALAKSFKGSTANFGAIIIWVLLYIVLAIVASIPLGLGWFVLGPMIIGACFAGWRTIYGD